MSTSRAESGTPRAVHVKVNRQALAVDLADGRTLLVPTAWYPRLLHANTAERNHWRLIGDGEGIHWPDLDEDISVGGLLAGHPSGESQASLKRWLARRGARQTKVTAQRAGAGQVREKTRDCSRATTRAGK